MLRKELTWHCAPRAAAARVLCLQLPLLSTLSLHSPRQRLETQVYRTISLPCLISEIGSSDTRANVNESFEEMRNEKKEGLMKEKYVAAVLFPALTHCVLPHITASHSHLSHSGSNSPLFFKTARSFAAFECRPVTQTGLLDVNMSIIFRL